jgi:hypothetical protein
MRLGARQGLATLESGDGGLAGAHAGSQISLGKSRPQASPKQLGGNFRTVCPSAFRQSAKAKEQCPFSSIVARQYRILRKLPTCLSRMELRPQIEPPTQADVNQGPKSSAPSP